MATDIDICSRSLSLLGEEAIQGFDEDTDLAATCAQLYPSFRKDLLSRENWRFATKIISLARNPDAPSSGWLYAFPLPSDRVSGPLELRTISDPAAPTLRNFTIIGTEIHTHEATLWMTYRFDASETQWPYDFENLAVNGFAAVLAMPVTEQKSKAKEFREVSFGLPSENGLGGLFGQVRYANARQLPTTTILQNGDPLSDARHS